ncbi:MAG: helix-turn-helix domain-containing protein, partial [candidate division WOR-3 bacterium]
SSSNKKEKFKEMNHSHRLGHIFRRRIALFISCQFHRQSFLSIPTYHPIRNFIFIKIHLDNHCIFLYIIVRFCEKLYFKKRISIMEEKEIMTVKQIAEYLQMDEHTVYKLARSGQIPSLKIAGQWRFKKEVIDKWISEESLDRITQNIKSSSEKKRVKYDR